MSKQTYSPQKICTICREWNGDVLVENEAVFVIRCKECNLYYVDYPPPEGNDLIIQGMSEAEEGEDYLKSVYEEKYREWYTYFSEWLSVLSEYATGKKLLDIGCGPGYLVKAAIDSGWDAYGLDLSSETIAFGRKTLGLDGRLYDELLEDVDYLNDFDVITLFSVIEHVEDPFSFLKLVWEKLEDKGIVLIKTPSQASLITKMHWALNRSTNGKIDFDLYNQEHIYRFSPKTLNLLLERVGFQILANGSDDHLWITATRYLNNKNSLSTLRYGFLWGIMRMGEKAGMENQIYTVARKIDDNQ